jgi:hypothetical protein
MIHFLTYLYLNIFAKLYVSKQFKIDEIKDQRLLRLNIYLF